jgi:exonuclease SbcC
VFEKHKLARNELEKLQAQASGVLLLSDEQQQALQQSLQALTDEERLQLTSKPACRRRSSGCCASRAQRGSLAGSDRLQDAQQALDQAQPQLAALLNAQPAEQLRPLWTRQQEQSAALAQTHRQVEEVNTRLQDRLRLRAGIRLAASQQMTRLQDAHHALNLWLKEHDRYRQWGNSLAGWRAVSSSRRAMPAAERRATEPGGNHRKLASCRLRR